MEQSESSSLLQKDMTPDELLFVILCLEGIGSSLGVNPAVVYNQLANQTDILTSYLLEFYDVLHTQSIEYVVDDVIDVMRERGLVA